MKFTQNTFFIAFLLLCINSSFFSKKFSKTDLEGRPIILVQKTACNHKHESPNENISIINSDKLIQMAAKEKITSIEGQKQSILAQLDDSSLDSIERKINKEQLFRRNLRRSIFEEAI